MAGRPSAVERSRRVGFDVSEREVDVERRGEDLGGQAGGDTSHRQLGRQRTDRRTANAGIDELAGLEAFGVAAAACRDFSAIERNQIRRGGADVDQETASLGYQTGRQVASASQLAAAAMCGRSLASATE